MGVAYGRTGGVHKGPYEAGKRQGNWVERDKDGYVSEGVYVDSLRHGWWFVRNKGIVVEEGVLCEGGRPKIRLSSPMGARKSAAPTWKHPGERKLHPAVFLQGGVIGPSPKNEFHSPINSRGILAPWCFPPDSLTGGCFVSRPVSLAGAFGPAPRSTPPSPQYAADQ